MTPSRYLPAVAKHEPQTESPGLPACRRAATGCPRDFVVQNQRDRLAAGIIAAVCEFGYHETTITQIAGAAGVSRRTFYGYFDSKEECFLEAFDQIAAHLREASREAAAGESRWPVQVAARFDAALDVFSTNPPARPFHARGAAAGRAARSTAHYRQALDAALAELVEGMPCGRRPGPSDGGAALADRRAPPR